MIDPETPPPSTAAVADELVSTPADGLAAAADPDPDPDPLAASLGRRFRGALLKLEIELRTAAARQVFQRDFVYVSQQLHALESSRRVQGVDRPLLREALAVVARHVESARTGLLGCATQARALIALHGQGHAELEFARPVRLHASIVSPFARDYLELLGHADEALSLLEKAWLLGLLDPALKARQASECRRLLQGVKEIVRQQRHVVGNHVRELNASRRLRRLQPPAASTDAGAATPGPDIDADADDEGEHDLE